MFRDRVVSMEQTQEIGEKHIDLLTAIATEALPGFSLSEHGLEHEQDLYVLTVANAATGETRRICFTRMVLSDADRLQAVVKDASVPMRGRMVDLIRAQAARREILVSLRQLLSDEERLEADEIDGECRRKNEAALAARRAEEERRGRERRRQKQAEDARRQAQRERERRPQATQTEGPGPQPGASPGEGGGRRRRRRRGGRGREQTGAAAPLQQQAQAPPQRPEAGAPQAPGVPRPPGGGRRRRRRGRRGGGGPQPGGGPVPG